MSALATTLILITAGLFPDLSSLCLARRPPSSSAFLFQAPSVRVAALLNPRSIYPSPAAAAFVDFSESSTVAHPLESCRHRIDIDLHHVASPITHHAWKSARHTCLGHTDLAGAQLRASAPTTNMDCSLGRRAAKCHDALGGHTAMAQSDTKGRDSGLGRCTACASFSVGDYVLYRCHHVQPRLWQR